MFSQAVIQISNLLSTLNGALITPQGESSPSTETSVVTTFANGYNQVSLPTLSGNLVPSGWRIYKGTSPGQESYYTTISGDRTTWIDDGTYTGTITSPPSASYGYLGQLPSTLPNTTTITNPGTAFLDLSSTGTSSHQTINAAAGGTYSQPFVANRTNLDSISLPIDLSSNAGNGGITLSIYPNVNTITNSSAQNIPGTYTSTSAPTPIVSVTLTAAQVQQFGTTSNYTKFQFPTPVTLTQGNIYHITLHVNNSNDSYLWYGSFGGTALTSCYNAVRQATWPYAYETNQGGQTGFGWNSSITGAFGYQIYAQGTLTPATYYYVITAMSGFAPKGKSSYVDANGVSSINIYVCTGDGTAKFYPYIGVYGNNAQMFQGMYENYSVQNSLIVNTFSNGLSISNQSYVLNNLNEFYFINTNAQSSTANVTFRLHNYSNYWYLNLVGDSANTGFQESISFVGMPTTYGAGDKAYVVSGGFNGWVQLRDFNNNVAPAIYPIIPTTSQKLFQTSQNLDVMPYLNSYTGNNEGFTLNLADAFGVRAQLPGLILLPHGSNTSINNHDTIITGGNTYEVYQTENYSGNAPTYRPFAIWNSAGGYLTAYYPAIQIS